MINAPESMTAASQELMHERPMMRLKGQLQRLCPNLAPDASLAKYTRAIEQCRLMEQLPATTTSGTGGKCSRKAAKEFKELYNLSATTTPTNESSYRFFATIRCLMYLESPRLKTIVISDEQKAFMRQCVLDFTRAASYYRWHLTSPLFPVQSLFNHSCDPNVLIVILSGHVKLVVFRPIRPNEQICFSYGHRWWDTPMCQEPFQMVFVCKCVVCDPSKKIAWLASKRELTLAAKAELVVVGMQVCGSDSDDVADLALIQTYIERNARFVRATEAFMKLLSLHWTLLFRLLRQEDEAQRRAKVAARLAGAAIDVVD
ncbi:hypothetical protein pipiens_016991 [Culex pipiens pipiens]|uniref:SET domain-containing protein n=1 Tax=Culex pipiens pipiens TaxID=38569 RepID=A0ABD1CIN4_CULPP